MRLEIQLQCGHRSVVRQWPETDVYCPECDAIVRLWAIECREYHVQCQQCRFGRWCGSSRENAIRERTGHANRSGHENLTLDYLLYPQTDKKFHQLYPGRSIHPQIIARRELPAHPIRYRLVPDQPPF